MATRRVQQKTGSKMLSADSVAKNFDSMTARAAAASFGAKDLVGLCKPICSSIPAPLLILDASARVVSASEVAGTFLGHPLSDIIGSVFSNFLALDESGDSCTRTFFTDAISKMKRTACTAIIAHGDGSRLTVEIAANPIIDGGDRFLIIALRDLTAVQTAERDRDGVAVKYRALFQNMNRGVAIYEAIDGGRDFIFKDFNHPAELMERLKHEDVVGKPVTEVFPGVTSLGLLEVLRRVWKTGKSEHLPPALYEDSRLGRSWRKNDAYKLPTGEVVCVYVNVTDRMETLRKLEESEIRYRALFENMRSGVAVYEAVDKGRDFIIKEFNEAAERSDKVKRTEVVGKPVSEVFPSAGKIGFLDVLRRVWTDGKPEYFPPTLYEDSRIGVVWWEDYVYKLPTGELVATFENVTERMKAGEDLKKTVAQVIAERDKIDTIVQSIADAVFVVDRNGTIILFNEAASAMSGVSVADAIGKKYETVLRFVAGEDEKRADAFIRTAQETGVASSAFGNVVLVDHEGKRIPVATSASPLKSTEGVNGAVVVFRDVASEREADRVKTEFASITSIQLQTPLKDAQWFIDLMLRGKAGEIPPKAKEYLEQMNATNERIIRIVEKLLALSKSEVAQTVGKTSESVDVTEIIRGVIAENIDLIRQNRVTVELGETIPKKFYLRVDPNAIREVFRHLISNAVKYSKASGKVSVCFDGDRKDALLFSVKDDGYGIPSRQQSRIFEKFFRADNVLTRFPEGTGLGLSSCRSAVESLGGRLWFSSIENVGSTFYFTLPKTTLPGKRQRAQTERSATHAVATTAREEGWLDAE